MELSTSDFTNRGLKMRVKEESVMEIVNLIIQSCIGLIFAVYGICSLLANRKKQTKGKYILSSVCVLVGIFLLGCAVYQIL